MTAPSFTAPTKNCPHCGAMSQTTADRCPNCNKKFKKKSPVLKILLGITLLGILLIGGCTALVGGAINEGVKSVEEESAKSAITVEQWNQIKPGQTKEEVLEIVAPAVPSDEQTTESASEGFEYNSNCLYFNKAGESFSLIAYQVCLSDGKVTTKSAF